MIGREEESRGLESVALYGSLNRIGDGSCKDDAKNGGCGERERRLGLLYCPVFCRWSRREKRVELPERGQCCRRPSLASIGVPNC